jgi:hypothetical protein
MNYLSRCKYRILSRDGNGAVRFGAFLPLAANSIRRFFPEHQLHCCRGSEWEFRGRQREHRRTAKVIRQTHESER